MSTVPLKVLFIDRDGTLVVEPPDEQVDRLEKIRFVPDVFASLQQLVRAGYRLVMVTNQDGLGTASFPQADFQIPQQFILDTFASQGIGFDAICICPHKPADGCDCRKPQVKIVEAYLRDHVIDLARSAVIGDRDSDLAFAANLGIRGLRLRLGGSEAETWPAIARELLARRASVRRTTKETDITVSVDLDAEGPIRIATGHGFFDHMLEQLAKHGGFAMDLACKGDLHIDEHHTVEDCALAIGEALRKALGAKAGIGRFGFLLAMDESRAQVAIDLSGRPYSVFEGRFGRTEVGGLATELVPHFFRSLADSLGCALHVSVTGENTHHMVEACFKGTGRALRQAFRREGSELPSTKGVLYIVDVAIIDSGGANLASLVYALERLGARAVVTDQAQVIRAAPRVLLPGVGSAGNAMARLRAAKLDTVIPQLTQPLLGICLGMQLLFEASAEGDDGDTQCLGIIPGRVARLAASPERPVPHMGWNRLQRLVADPLLAGIGEAEYFYFVHSFAAPVGAHSLAVTEYGETFTSVARHGNFRGAQFHPERSARPGARLLANFLAI